MHAGFWFEKPRIQPGRISARSGHELSGRSNHHELPQSPSLKHSYRTIWEDGIAAMETTLIDALLRMPTLEGHAFLVDGTERREVRLQLDLRQRNFVVEYPCDDDLFEILRRLSANEPEVAFLENVAIRGPTGSLVCSQTEKLYVANRVSGEREQSATAHGEPLSNESEASRTRLTLSPACSLVEFITEKAEGNALTLRCHRAAIPRTQFTLDGASYTFDFKDSHCTISCSEPIWGSQRRLRLAISILLGTRAQLFAVHESNTLRLSLANDVEYQRSHPLFDHSNFGGPMMECLVRFLLALSDRDFDHWYKATAFMIEGKSSFAELDIRITNLFVFLEMFDDANTLSGSAVARMLDIPLSDAKLLCGVRNKLVHGRHTLLEAIDASDAEQRAHNPHHVLQAFAFANQSPAVVLYLRLCERINAFIARSIGWSGPHHTYRSTLTPYLPS